ncbi:MAG TPA: N-formylglutamate amidohydrolase [Pseudobdellovibrionaceae bacterium]|nr:N-formylglutamate amidohydrolase [Pseudobdellovibrionaceae bacterium]
MKNNVRPVVVTIPHSGERIPPEADWLNGLPEVVQMRDVDRFVDRLYRPVLSDLNQTAITTEWHRYAGDLNRLPSDIDAGSVVGNPNVAGKYARGFLWTMTTLGEKLMSQPISPEVHLQLVNRIYEPFHAQVRGEFQRLKSSFSNVFHLDLHSMPSVGTGEHRDPGERRADVVVSDCGGKSCAPAFRDLVILSYVLSGFKVGYNWPYLGGRLTEQYGDPKKGFHSIQVELNRSLYMNEETKKFHEEKAQSVQKRLGSALNHIVQHLPSDHSCENNSSSTNQ